MRESAYTVLTLATALGCGLIAGVFFAFSAFVMTALARLPAPQGIAAMQSINVLAVTPWFMSALFGTAAACLVLAVAAVFAGDTAGSGHVVAGCASYLVGTILVTMACNVPRNTALARSDPASAEGARLWADYLRTWTMWNHVRTLAALTAATLLALAFGLQPR